jgi:hypothetical protein
VHVAGAVSRRMPPRPQGGQGTPGTASRRRSSCTRLRTTLAGPRRARRRPRAAGRSSRRPARCPPRPPARPRSRAGGRSASAAPAGRAGRR